jgi:protein SCO1
LDGFEVNMVKRWLWLILLAALLSGCGSQTAYQWHGAVFDPPRYLTDFTMPSTDGTDFTLSQHRGQTILLYFGYRSCPDFCPTTFAALQQVYSNLKQPKDKLKIVFVTVDPDRDTLDNLTLYVHAFNQDFIGLRDDGDGLKQLMKQFGVVAEKRQVGDSPLSYLIDHTASLFLITADGQLKVQYLYGTDNRDILADLRTIIKT